MSDIGRSERRMREERRAVARSDQIEVHGLEVFAHHGVYDDEREHGQRFVIDLVLDVDTHIAARTDHLEDAVDYGEVARNVAQFVRSTRFDLLEALATRIADHVLRSPRVATVTVRRARPLHLS